MIRLLVLGDLNLDVRAEEPALTLGSEETRSDVRVVPGGSAGTFARVAVKLGVEVTFLGTIGNDAVGDMLEQDLAARGVRPRLRRVDRPSGVVLALHRGDDRTMVCSRGANDALDEGDVDPELFRNLDHVHVSGYAFLTPPQARAVRRAIAIARDHGATVSVTAPPANLIEAFGVTRFRSAIREADVLVLNRTEGQLLTGCTEDAAAVDALAAMHSAGALTCGSRGAYAWRGNERAQALPRVVLHVDPTGAGDAFAAAFVVHLLTGDPLAVASRLACEAARHHLEAQ